MPNTSDPDHLLATILPFAVAMEIHRMADLDPATRTRFITAHAPHSADLVGSQADQLLQGGHARLSKAIQPALTLDIEGAARA